MKRLELSAGALRELVDYNPETGIFCWKGLKSQISSGQQGRYVRIAIWGRTYLAHKLVWLYVYGKWPETGLDHIDRNTKNNAISNLREVSSGDNLRNSKSYSNNKTGFRGVMFEARRGLFKAQITLNKRNIFLGYFKTAEEAGSAYQIKMDELTEEGKIK